MASSFQARGFKVVSNGTENHLFLVDLVDKCITGKAADAALGRARNIVNRNSVPNDPQSPFVTSGLRIGSPAMTKRGFGVTEADQLVNWICDVLEDTNNEAKIAKVVNQVTELCKRFPVYSDFLRKL